MSYIGMSDQKKEAMLLSIHLHIRYLRSLEESERTRKACLAYIENWLDHFYPERPDLVDRLQSLAGQLGGHLEPPRLRWKYAWMKPLIGFGAAKRVQMVLPDLKASLIRSWDKAMYKLETHNESVNAATETVSLLRKD